MSLLKKDLKKPRKEQEECLNYIKNILEKEVDKKYFLLDLPTGVGKSQLAFMIFDHFIDKYNKDYKFDIIMSSKILQTQYTDEFKSVNNLWGRENYDCEQFSCSCAQGKDFNKIKGTKCEGCPYDMDKNNWMMGNINMTNFHMFIIFQMYQEEFMDNRQTDILIIDEAQDFEDVFAGFISINLNEHILKKMKFSDTDKLLEEFKRIHTLDDFIEFCTEFFIEHINKTRIELASTLANKNIKVSVRDNKFSKALTGEKNNDFKILEIIIELEQYKLKIENFIEDYKINQSNWVLEKNVDKKNISLSIEPVWVSEYLDKYVFSKYKKVFFMSGTILNKELFSKVNGLDSNKTVYYKIDSPFPAKNRPIYYMPVGKLTYTTKEQTFEKYIPYINKLLNKYKNQKGVIHTVTYELSKWVQRDIEDKRLIFHESDSKDYALRKHLNSSDPTVIVSPSMGTGVNFNDDKARFQILLKVPYPSLASQKNKMRQKTVPDWYVFKSISSLMQIYGRGCRHMEDNCSLIILDGCFGDVLKYSSSWIPEWVKDSIKRVEVN